MADETKDPILAEAIRKREELDTFIRVYQEMKAHAASPPTVPTTTAAIAGNGRPPSASDPLSAVYPGMFFGKSQPQAVKMFLEQCHKRPQRMKVLLEALDKGGAKVGGKKPAVNLWGVLDRSDDFVLVPKAGWGLAEWYDPSVLAKLRKEEEAKDEGQDKDDAPTD